MMKYEANGINAFLSDIGSKSTVNGLDITSGIELVFVELKKYIDREIEMHEKRHHDQDSQ